MLVVFVLLQLFIFRVVRGPFEEEFYQCVTYGSYSAPWQEQLYTVMSLLLMFVLPLATLVATYAATFQTIASKYMLPTDGCFLFTVSSSSSVHDESTTVDCRWTHRSLLFTSKILNALVDSK